VTGVSTGRIPMILVYPSHIPTMMRKLNPNWMMSTVRSVDDCGMCWTRTIEPSERASPKTRSERVSILTFSLGSSAPAGSGDRRIVH
jgi:hypothetical protein